MGSTLKDTAGNNDATLVGTVATTTGMVGNSLSFSGDGNNLHVTDSPSLNPTTGLSVVAWVNGNAASGTTKLQPIVSKWQSQTTLNSFSAFDIRQLGLSPNSSQLGGGGAVYDGRYMYFAVPNFNGTPSIMYRYDTQGEFKSVSSWASYDATSTDGLNVGGFQGAVFDGRYVYYIPYRNGAFPAIASAMGYLGRVLRYDTQGTFTESTSWSAYDAGNTGGFSTIGFFGATFDGRYIYFSPFVNSFNQYFGAVVRYDTQGGFKDSSSWVAYNAANTNGSNTSIGYQGAIFDGRYVYFVPQRNSAVHGFVLRYDTQSSFTSASSWRTYDAGSTNSLVTKSYNGGTFDGRYLYFAPQQITTSTFHGRVLRYDTQADFNTSSSWNAYDAGNTSGLDTAGYTGATFDGRYVYFHPNADSTGATHGRVLRYDTTNDFNTASSWSATDAGATDGLDTKNTQGSGFDGRYIYFPKPDVMLRYDTTGTGAGYALDYSNTGGTNGRSGALPGIHFRVNTTNGVASAGHYASLATGWHLVAGTYDGTSVKLYVDGVLVRTTNVPSGSLVASTGDLVIGGMVNSRSAFLGATDEVQIYGSALGPAQIASLYNAGSAGTCPSTIIASVGGSGPMIFDRVYQFVKSATLFTANFFNHSSQGR